MISSTGPIYSRVSTLIEWAKVSPVANDAEKSKVASISPNTISEVCALRRGIFRIAILNTTGLLRANAPVASIARRKTPLNE